MKFIQRFTSVLLIAVLLFTGNAFTAFASDDSIGAKTAVSEHLKKSKKQKSVINTGKKKYSYKRMEKDIKKLCKMYPEIITYRSLGKTYDSRCIYDVVLGNENAKKQLVFQASMHAREYINTTLIMKQIENICQNYYTGKYKSKKYSTLFNNVCIHFIPMTNPDGVTISQYGANGIKNKKLRKNLRKMCRKYGKGKRSYYTRWKANARGVDLNRNYPLNWYSKHASGLQKPNQCFYKGPEPASEKETKIMINFIKNLKPDTVISYHTTGSVIYWNFYIKDRDFTKRQKSLYKTAYKLTGYSKAKDNSSKPGLAFGDWVANKMKINTLTIENCTGSAPNSMREFSKIWKKNKNMPMEIAIWTLKNK